MLSEGDSQTHVIGPRLGVWLQMIKGAIKANSDVVVAGDGVARSREQDIRIEAIEDAEFLLFYMAL